MVWHTMRRKDREHNDPAFIDDVMSRAEEMFLALNNGEYPYCLPLNFAKVGNAIYLHSATDGTKLELIKRDGHVAFGAACDVEIIREKNTTHYKSVCGTGNAVIVEDMKEKGFALDAIAARYGSRCQRPAPEKDINRVAIIRIDIVGITGKACLPG